MLGLLGGLALDAGAAESNRRAPRSDRSNAPNWQQRNDFLAGMPDSALRLPPNLRSAHVTAGPGKIPAGAFAATSRPRSDLRDVHRGSLATNTRDRYDRFCDNMTAKLWDEPNGKRLKFDIKGKPGIAIAIPVH